eukprot:TRINITY_DN11444_c0_g1_i3.p1 TRINITY_DN11444_c0_g1~~TRINITY_DN11444_c0_g1_i3.p1  ORF type:complete len:189 (+),score=57.06 TRINITY_DN11444_c0_g1_i3:38-604(+)
MLVLALDLCQWDVSYFYFFFFFQAEDGIRDVERSRGLGDVYKRQVSTQSTWESIDFMEELDAHGELLDYISPEIKDLISDTLRAINGTVLAAHRILNKLKIVDPVLYAEVTLQAGELNEKLHEYRTSIQVLRSGVSKIVEYRENMMKMGADGKENLISPMYITCNNYTIDGIEKKMSNALQNLSLIHI